jgi:protein TonB
VSPAGDVVGVSDPKWQLTIGSDSNIGDEASYWASKPWLPFVRAAEAAARQWKFEPATTETTCKIDFGFRTRKKDPHDAAPSASVASTRPGEPTSLPKTDAPLRVGGVIKPPRKVVDAKPVYPEDARDGAVEGVVVLDLTIAKDGTVSNAVVRRSIPLLDQAAIDAVRQWRFEPTLLNGAPVEIVMTVTINFNL